MPVITFKNLRKAYGSAEIIHGIDLVMEDHEFTVFVGPSGCGKSTVALGVMQDLGVNGRIVEGTIKFKGQNLNDMSSSELQKIRGSEIAMIYQEPMASLNPSMRIAQQLMEVPMCLTACFAAAHRLKFALLGDYAVLS